MQRSGTLTMLCRLDGEDDTPPASLSSSQVTTHFSCWLRNDAIDDKSCFLEYIADNSFWCR